MINEKLEKLNQEIAKGEARLRRAQHEEKILEHQVKQLTRKERTHRLCTRGAMLESFLLRPEVLTDEDVMDILKQAFSQSGMKEIVAESVERAGSRGIPYGVRAQLYTGQAGALRPAGGFLRKADDFQHRCGCFQSSQGTLHFPCAGCASYPFVDLPPGNTLRCKLFPSSKFTIYLFQNRTARSIIKLMTNTI